MPIIISVTYSIMTPESAELGDYAELGFEFENVEYSFKELVDYIKSEGFIYPDTSHGIPCWLSTDAIHDRAYYEKGEERTLSIHPGKDKQSQRYWVKACRAAGVIK